MIKDSTTPPDPGATADSTTPPDPGATLRDAIMALAKAHLQDGDPLMSQASVVLSFLSDPKS